jgi:hypothetical protein
MNMQIEPAINIIYGEVVHINSGLWMKMEIAALSRDR